MLSAVQRKDIVDICLEPLLWSLKVVDVPVDRRLRKQVGGLVTSTQRRHVAAAAVTVRKCASSSRLDVRVLHVTRAGTRATKPGLYQVHPALCDVALVLTLTPLIDAAVAVQGRHVRSESSRCLEWLERVEERHKLAAGRLVMVANRADRDLARRPER